LDGFVVGAATSMAAVAALYLGARFASLPFPPFDLFERVTRLLPGAIVTAGIDLLVRVIRALALGPTAAAAKTAEQLLALALFVCGSGVLGAAAATSARRVPLRSAGVACAVAWLAAIVASEWSLGTATAIGIGWVALVLAAWGLLLAACLERLGRETAAKGRRRFLGELAALSAAGAAALAGIAWLLGHRRRRAEPAPVAERLPQPARPRAVEPVAGTRSEVTSNARFYRIDIDLAPPRVDPVTWRLRVAGQVDAALALTLDAIRALPSVTQDITLECISNPLGGDLVSTSRWTGVPLRDVLALARPHPSARTIRIDAADGYYEALATAEADDPRVLLVYAMNGEPLPAEHGFPLRIYIPNRHGMKQPKWIERLTLTDRDVRGYWVERGWSEEAVVKTTSVIDVVGPSSGEIVPVGGMAFAGARGISRVEVQVDDGPWAAATLVTPPLGPLTWVLWRYDWPRVRGGRHTFRVRAYDGTGALQPTIPRQPHPDGASGVHELTRDV
jgi:DMSO/TMAO reductase YedYZ molybdopterin-dependent catalytic subunit